MITIINIIIKRVNLFIKFDKIVASRYNKLIKNYIIFNKTTKFHGGLIYV